MRWSVCLLFPCPILIGCGTLEITAERSAHCTLKPGPPHEVVCSVDGETVYSQTGPMVLRLSGCARSVEE